MHVRPPPSLRRPGGLALRVGGGLVAVACHSPGALAPPPVFAAPMGRWADLGALPSPLLEARAQGLTALAGGRLLYSDHWDDVESRVYELGADGASTGRRFTMPVEARHTSGLCHHGDEVWAVDHRSNLLYLLDLEAGFTAGAASVRESYVLPTVGSSACTVTDGPDGPLMLISDYRETRITTIYDLAALRAAAPADAVRGWYRNCGYSQGLATAGSLVLEACNTVRGDRIVAYPLAALLAARGAAPRQAWTMRAPGLAIEDMTFDGEALYVSDEGTNHLYRLDLPLPAPAAPESAPPAPRGPAARRP